MAAAISFLVVLAVAGVDALLGAPPPGTAKVPALLAFGDSVVDTGNNNYIRTIIRANFPPYGRDFPGRKPTGRFSDGKISIDFLASALGVKEMVPPYLDKNLSMNDLKTGVSFASAGSGYDNASCRTMSAMTVERQLQLFKEYKAKVGGVPEKTLYLLCWGTNEVVQHFTIADGKTEPQYSDFMVQRASSTIQALVDLGARLVVVVGAPPVGCVPAQRIIAGGVRRQCATNRNQVALLFNRKLSQEISRLNGKLPGVKIVNIDLYSLVSDVMHRYQALASVLCNFASPLCGDPPQYVFWDSYHPTERAYKLMVDEVVDRYLGFLK
ncbi:hypothetical protein ABZP36_011294 [Zizania latifolia]